MADIAPEDFYKRIGFQPPVPQPEELAKTQATYEAAQQARPQIVPQSRFAVPDIATELGARPGIPFETEGGLPWSERYEFEQRETDADKQAWLELRYPGKYRKNKFGHWIVTKEQNGKPADVMVNQLGLDWNDMAAVAAKWPETIGAILGLAATRGMGGVALGNSPGFWKTAIGLASANVGSQVAGGLNDVYTRASDKQPVDLSEIALRRTAEGGFGTALDALMLAPARGLMFIRSPFSGNKDELVLDAAQAKKYLNNKYGVDVRLTPAERTGSPSLMAAESIQLSKPGAATPATNFVREKAKEVQELAGIMTGKVPDNETTGSKVLQAIGAKISKNWEFPVDRATYETIGAAEQAIQNSVGKRANKPLVGAISSVGAKLQRSKYQLQAENLYQNVYAHPLGDKKVIPVDPMLPNARKLIDELPHYDRIVTNPTGLFTPAGVPITTTSVKKEPIKEFVPDYVLPKLNALLKGKGQFVGLKELITMRTSVDDDIIKGQALGNVSTHYLQKIRDLLTDRITQGTKDLDPDLYNRWKTANDYVANNIGKFKQSGIAEFFRDPEQGSFLGLEEIVDRATSTSPEGNRIYRIYSDFFGANSFQMKGIQQVVRDRVLGRSDLGDVIDAPGFVRRLEDLDKTAPQMLEDAFGKSTAQMLRKEATILKAVKGGQVDKQELVDAVNSGSLTAKKFTELISAQEERVQVYRNELLKMISKGSVDTERIRAHEVVDKFVFRDSTQPGDLKELMDLIKDKPQLVEEMQTLTFKRVLDDATTELKTGQQGWNGMAIKTVLDDQDKNKRLTIVLGKDRVEDLRQFSNLLRVSQHHLKIGGSAGSLATGSQVAQFWEHGKLGAVDKGFRNFLMAYAYLSQGFGNYISNQRITPADKALIQAVILGSEPFLQAAGKVFSHEFLRDQVVQAKDGFGQLLMSADRMIAEAPKDIPWDEFSKRLGMTNQPVATPR